jgi:hypothetical protein
MRDNVVRQEEGEVQASLRGFARGNNMVYTTRP